MKKYYTCFLFQGEPDPKKLHCTHKYLGEQDQYTIDELVFFLNFYFRGVTVEVPRVRFSMQGVMGAGKTVLQPLNRKSAALALLPNLRRHLSDLRKDDYNQYHPHVTTDLDVVDLRITAYALVEDNKVIASWDINGA